MAKDLQNLLVRKVYTQTQTRLRHTARHQIYILFDDIITTGSTFSACAAALRETGATQIKVATLGHG